MKSAVIACLGLAFVVGFVYAAEECISSDYHGACHDKVNTPDFFDFDKIFCCEDSSLLLDARVGNGAVDCSCLTLQEVCDRYHNPMVCAQANAQGNN